jgi:rubrerythrin
MSIIWTLRKYVDSITHREEDARQQRDRKVARRQGISDGDDEVNGSSPAQPVKVYECRVCGLRGSDDAYCPDCLAETMVEVPPDTKPGRQR